MWNVTLPFAPLATGLKFGSDSTGSLKSQSEVTLNGISSDPNNAVKQFGSDFNEIATSPDLAPRAQLFKTNDIVS